VACLMVTRLHPTLGTLRLKSQMCNISYQSHHHVPSSWRIIDNENIGSSNDSSSSIS
jgi:hypothetical protein